jgi:hypothetical protein
VTDRLGGSQGFGWPSAPPSLSKMETISRHVAQFYSDHAIFLESVTHFIGAPLKTGNAAIEEKQSREGVYKMARHLGRWATEAKNHILKYRPKMAAELQAQGKLDDWALTVADKAGDEEPKATRLCDDRSRRRNFWLHLRFHA